MSEFNKYARQLDEIAKNAFKEYTEAADRLKKAEAAAKEYPPKHGFVDAEFMARKARAEADLLEAKQAKQTAKRALESHTSEIEALRRELAAALEDAFSVDPAALDTATLELLKSGILRAGEYEKLLRDAQAANNHTMVRLIGKFAENEAEAQAAKNGATDSTARRLRAVSHESRNSSGSDRLKAFDYLIEVYGRTASNPAMIDHWDELTAATVENF